MQQMVFFRKEGCLTLRFVLGHQGQYQKFVHPPGHAEVLEQFHQLLAFQHSTSRYLLLSTLQGSGPVT